MALSMLALAERSADYLRDNPESDSISPLPSFFRDGLIAISVFACLSFILTTSLWIYLTYKLVSWRLNLRSRARMVAKNIPDPSSPLHNLDFKNRSIALQQGEHARAVHESNLRQLRDAKNESPNQFLVLIYNLFLADMHQSAAFLLSASWLRHNGIFIHKASCFIQGYSDSNGDLSSSCFITFIAVHTYLSVVKGYEPPQRVLYLLIILIWIFVYSMSTIPLLVTHNGKAVGGYFVRAGAWVRVRCYLYHLIPY